jgi:hypothetical protein
MPTAPAAFDRYRQERYLDAVQKGHSQASAAREAGVSTAVVTRHANLNPNFAAAEREAFNSLLGEVEDQLYRTALGRRSPTQDDYVKDLREFHDEQGLPFKPIPPPEPSLKAQEIILSRRVPERWSSTASPSTSISVQALVTPEGAHAFTALLTQRQQAALASGPETVDAEVVPAD